MASCRSDVIKVGNEWWMYYSGWNANRGQVPYHNAMGLAVSHDEGLTFTRLADGPIMDRTFEEPYIAVTPTILKDASGFRMWYVSGIGWERIQNRYEPLYVIKYAESNNGIHWQRFADPVIHNDIP